MLKFILLGVFLMGCSSSKNESQIIVPTWFESEDGSFNPHLISNTYQAAIAKSLFSHLITINDNGDYEGVLADRYYWEGNDLVFEFIEDNFKSNGQKITTDEIYSSLVRQAEKRINLHGNLLSMVENESSNSIKKYGNKIVITFKPQYKKFGLAFFVSTEALILPQEVQALNRNLNLNDFKVTTGPYSVETFGNKKLILKSNPHHKFFDKLMPQKIELVEKYYIEDMYDVLRENEDFIIPGYIDIERRDSFQKLIAGEFNVFESQPIKLYAAAFRGPKSGEIPQERRIKIANKSAELFKNSKKFQQYFYLFPQNSFGSLLPEDEQKIRTKRSIIGDGENGEGLKLLYRDRKTAEIFEKSYIHSKVFPRMTIELDPNAPINPFYIEYIDVSFTEDFGMINYFFRRICKMSEEEVQSFFEQYLATDEDEKRHHLIANEHLKCLESGVFVPVGLSSYYIFSNKKWEINKSKLFSDTPFWKFRMKGNAL